MNNLYWFLTKKFPETSLNVKKYTIVSSVSTKRKNDQTKKLFAEVDAFRIIDRVSFFDKQFTGFEFTLDPDRP